MIAVVLAISEKKYHVVQSMPWIGNNVYFVSDRILKDAPYDPGMPVGLANVNDLIALEGKYHLICLKGFQRKIVKI